VAGAWIFGLVASCALVYLAAVAVRDLTGGPSPSALRLAIANAIFDPGWKSELEIGAIVAILALSITVPAFFCARLRWLRAAFAALAVHRTQAIFFTALLPMMIRLALLPVFPSPQPFVADEFGYLLLADTLASGRLANPTHPFWRHFESIYVLHQPSYASIYPVAPALLLALPKLLGVAPWLGVWLGVGLMCGLLCWMLQGWLPPKWALAGAVIAACRFGIVGPWMNTYWGGAAAAAGGALALGAFPRILRSHRVRDSLLFALGLAVLAQSRPYEGFVFGVPLVFGLGISLLRQQRVPLRVRLRNVVCPASAVLLLLVAGTLYYDSRVTGAPLLMPYGLHQKTYGTPQSFYWQPPVLEPPGIHRHQDIADVFAWQLAAYQSHFSWSGESSRLASFWNFYMQPLLTLPLLLLPFLCRRSPLIVPAAAVTLVLAANSLYPFFFPHYAAPVSAALLLLVVQGLRHLYVLRFRFSRAGQAAAQLLLLAIVASSALTAFGGVLAPWNITSSLTPRSEALDRLEALGGKHLVLVRYSKNHSFHQGVVFNGADIDKSAVVWARELDAASNRKLLAYFRDRDAWLFEPDEQPATLVPFPGKPYVAAVVNGAGRRDDTRVAVSPGGIALVFGSNFNPELRGTTVSNLFGSIPVTLCESGPEAGLVFSPSPSQSPGVSFPLIPDFSPPRPAPPQPAVLQSSAPHPLEAAGITVDFDGVRAPLLGVSRFGEVTCDDEFAGAASARGNLAAADSIAVQVPYEIAPGWTNVTVHAAGVPSTSRRVQVLPATPGVFQIVMSDGKRRALLLHGDGSLVDLSSPGRRGEILHSLSTGLGAVEPAVGTNGLGLSVTARVARQLVIGVDDRGVRLVSATYRSGSVGIEDVAFQIPANARTGDNIPFSVGAVVDGQTVYSNQSFLPVR
jgi:uncharacterized protein (TIGR03437 family)